MKKGNHMSMTLPHSHQQSTTSLTSNAITIDREAVFDSKRAKRNAGIDGLVMAAKTEGKTIERYMAAIEWDSNHAPKSTNLKQLAEIGIHPIAEVALSDEDINAALSIVIDGLAALGIYLTGTDHLSDRTLYRVLTTKVLHDEIRDIPPNDDMSEFIDLFSIPPTDRSDKRKGRCRQSAPYPSVVNRDASLPRPKQMTDAD
jgi:hypothetical protein